MRILLLTRPICPPWDEGSKDFAYTLAKYASNFEIHLLTCASNGSSTPSWKSSFQANVVCQDIYSTTKWDWRQKIRAYKFLVTEFLLKGGKDFDIVHSFFTPTMLNVLALRLCLRNKKIRTIQTLATLRDDLYQSGQLKKIIHADSVITYSDYAKSKLENIGYRNVKRIYPGIDVWQYSPAPKNLALLEKFKTEKDDFVVNYAGEYVRLGDMDDIIFAFSELAKIHKNIKLHLAVRVKNNADASKKKEVLEILEKHGLIERVAFIDDGSYTMDEIYNLADISIFPARTMAGKFDIPLVIIEAMACGKPIIASNLERLRYFLNDSNCVLIEPGNRQALKEKILYLYENKEERDKIGHAGIEYARDNFNIRKIVKEYEGVYNSMTKE